MRFFAIVTNFTFPTRTCTRYRVDKDKKSEGDEGSAQSRRRGSKRKPGAEPREISTDPVRQDVCDLEASRFLLRGRPRGETVLRHGVLESVSGSVVCEAREEGRRRTVLGNDETVRFPP